MGQFLLMGLAAGAASALLVAGVAAGTVLAVPLFYLAPLPVMVAGLAFSHWSAFTAVAVAAAGLGLTFGFSFLLAYVFGIGGPAWVLAYAALLARAEPAARDGLAWFPVGRLVLVAAGLAAFGVIVAVFSIASSFDAYVAAIADAFEAFMSDRAAGTTGDANDTAGIATLLAHLLPPMAATLSMMTQLGCLYLAGKAAQLSGRLARPWPDLADARLPMATSLVLAALIGLSVVPGLFGLSAQVAAATLLAAYLLAGFSVLHFITRGRTARLVVLTAAWCATLVLGWPALIVAVLGLADAMFDLRARFGRGGGPPAANDP